MAAVVLMSSNCVPDTFGLIRMGLITEMFLTFEGYLKPAAGDHLRISYLFKGVVQDVYKVEITQVPECVDEPETVLIQVKRIINVPDVKSECISALWDGACAVSSGRTIH
ncbi:hypothetical protein AU510_06345 [Lonsdalea britannica]|uniref:hypothetical protein n=1 Tax=Lonsdalea britannica TaxID=1082704 RepID=UPI000A1E6839|nr:hypothetical protein [Lonsdalea britannica]OSN07223.1 hypothetical protein AU510_06345 [Lonsdalea britannica]